jgi:hypothetical protein
MAMTLVACVHSPSAYPNGTTSTEAPTYASAPATEVGATRHVNSSVLTSSIPLPNNAENTSHGSLVEVGSSQGDSSPSVQIANAPASPPLRFQEMAHGSQPLRAKAFARRFGNLSPTLCSKELRNWKDSFKRVGSHKGIATPTRVIGVIEGVKFRVPGEKSKFGLLDCRLALTLVEFARFLRAREITEVVVDNFYRINARLPSARAKRSQHAYALADTEACGPEATLVSPTEHTEGLRTLVCELFAEQIFSHHLTPSHDSAHRNHLHLDIKRDAKSAVIK